MELPKYSKMEIERRFLVLADRLPALDSLTFLLIEDRYITATRLRLRSLTDSRTGAQQLKFCKKYEREEENSGPIVNMYLTKGEFDLLSQLPGHPIRKRRYHMDHAGHRWAIDVFLDAPAGLLLCEIELEDRLALVQLPPWAGDEVTLDVFFTGASLAGRTPEELRVRLASSV